MSKLVNIASQISSLSEETGHASGRALINLSNETVEFIDEYGDVALEDSEFCIQMPVRLKGNALVRNLRGDIVACDLGMYIPKT